MGRVYCLEAIGRISKNWQIDSNCNLLLTQIVSEVCDSVFAISDKLLLCLLAVIFFSVHI
jgi:hypothetical protein